MTTKAKDVQTDYDNTAQSEDGQPADIDPLKSFKGIMSVTDLIQNLDNGKGGPVSPKFELDNYWSHKDKDYRDGIFDAYELQFISDIVGFSDPKDAVPITDKETLDKIHYRLSNETDGLWHQQALCGSLIHNLLADFYKYKVKSGPYTGQYLYNIKSDDDVLKIYKREIIKRSYYNDFNKYITDDILKSVLKSARQIDKDVRRDCCGNDISSYPNVYIRAEQKIIGNAQTTDTQFQVMGQLDLIAVDQRGRIHIYDYKTSPKVYSEENINNPMLYNSAKVRTFMYQLAIYRRLLEQLGINPNDIDINVIPLQFKNFKIDSNQNVTFDGVTYDGIHKLPNNDASMGNDFNTIESNLNQCLKDYRFTDDKISQSSVLTNVKDFDTKCFPTALRDYSEKDIVEYIKHRGGIHKNKLTNKYEFTPDDKTVYTTDEVVDKPEAIKQIVADVKNQFDTKKRNIPTFTSSLRASLIKTINYGENDNLLETLSSRIPAKSTGSKPDPRWLQHRLQKYFKGNYEVITDDVVDNILDQYGIIAFRNTITGLIDIVRLDDTFDPTIGIKLKGRDYILGNFVSDIISHNSADSLTLRSTKGNITLMETMNVIDQLPNYFKNGQIGSISVINPKQQLATQTSNEQLFYNYRALCLHSGIKSNFISDKDSAEQGAIKMASFVDIAKADFREILSGHMGSFDDLNSATYKFIDAVKFDQNPQVLRQQLVDLDKQITEHERIIKDDAIRTDSAFRLHKDISFAIAELSGIKLMQQLEDSAKFGISRFGIQGTYIDNPGTLQSQALNQLANQSAVAYQNVRNDIISFNEDLRQRVIKLQKSQHFGWIQQNISGSQVQDIYYNMYNHTNNKFEFINPWNQTEVINAGLSPEQVEFLQYAILQINKQRYKTEDQDVIESLKNNKDRELYLKVPLMKGGSESGAAVHNGIINYARYRFSLYNPFNAEGIANIKGKLDKTVNQLLDDKEVQKASNGEQWEAMNTIKASEADTPTAREYRKKLLTNESLGGEAYFEHNLETILLKQRNAYKMEEELNKVFPTIRAINLYMINQGAILNKKFINDEEYALKYIQTRIHNLPYDMRQNNAETKAVDVLHGAMSVASKLALAWNPRQLYQFIDGLWKDIMVFVKFNNLDVTFTAQNLRDAWTFVITNDIFHLGQEKTFCQLLNEKYGFNDMDMNSYIDRIKSDNTGLINHFWDTGFRFASRPDYYNRMTLFLAQAMSDGVIKIKGNKVTADSAYQLKDGKLVYNWKLDDRFKGYLSNNTADKNKALSNIIRLTKQLQNENPDYLFNINEPNIPDPYSTKEIESMKAFQDRIYGYYAHEKKSMINSMTLGGAFMQMNTFWSAKKNQYAQSRSYTQEGKWENYSEQVTDENGKTKTIQYYYDLDKDGNITITTKNTGVPVQRYVGLPQEGIMVTMVDMIRSYYKGNSETGAKGLKGVKDMFDAEQTDPRLRRLQLSNLRQLSYDVMMYLIMGCFVGNALSNFAKEFLKEHPDDNLANAVANTSINLGVGLFNSSTQDFNALSSLVFWKDRGFSFTPFAFNSIGSIGNRVASVLSGNKDFGDAVVQSVAGLRAVEPIMDGFKIATVGRKIGQTAADVENNT